MDARVLLRRYLEQRRELGESELVLDSLNVDDVMRLLGAAGRVQQPPSRERSLRELAEEISGEDVQDWRASLREAGVNVDAEASAPKAIVAETSSETPDQMAFKKGIVVSPEEAELIPCAIEKLDTLDEIARKVQKCTRCPLYDTATNGVPGEGDPKAKLICVGEAPGAKEDETGRPFVGQAGQLLTKILAAIDLTREQVFICKVLKPKVIVAFGTFAAQTLLNTKTPIGQLRGLVHRYHGIPLVVTYHPAALLRNPSWKRPTWEDVKLARRILDSTTNS